MDLNRDETFMSLALESARSIEFDGGMPIGSVLVIDGKFVDRGYNTQIADNNYSSHAETNLIRNHGSEIKMAHKGGKSIEIFSTLEPCLQCFGALVHNRFSRIVYASPDPCAGATHIKPITPWYEKRWPEIKGSVLRDEAFDLFLSYMKNNMETWKNTIPYYENMAENW